MAGRVNLLTVRMLLRRSGRWKTAAVMTSIATLPPVPSMADSSSAGPRGHAVACAVTGGLLGLTQGFGLYLVSSNLGSIQGALGATAAEASWLISAYTATALSSTLLLTKVRLQFGLRAFAVWGLLAFLAVAALHLATDSVAAAVAARAALGLAAAPLSTLAVFYFMEALPQRLAPVALLLGFAALQLPGPLARVLATELLEKGQWHGLFMLDVALSVLSLGTVLGVRLKAQPRQDVFVWGDLLAFPLYAGGLALLCVAVSQGRLAWWTDTPWLGQCLALGIAFVGLYVVVDLGRRRPLLDLKWLSSGYMVRFVIAVLLFRIVLSEQTVAVVGLMGVLGQSNDQMRVLFALASLSMLVGFLLSMLMAKRGWLHSISIVSALFVCAAAWMDSDVTALVRPQDLYLSQSLLAMGLATFFSAALLLGFGPVIQEGGKNMVSFLAAFSFAQYMGSLMGSAWIGTTVAELQQKHYHALVQHLTTADPAVTLRVAQLGGAVARVVNDPAARSGQALAMFSQQVTRESYVLAYGDLFQLIAWVSLGMAAWLAMLGWRAHRRSVAARPTP